MKTLLLAAACTAALAGCGQAPAADDPEYNRALGHAGLLAYSSCNASRLSPAAVDMIKASTPAASPAVKDKVEAKMLAIKRKFGSEFSFCAELEAAVAPNVDRANDLALTRQLMR